MFGNEYNQIGMEMFFINTDVQLFLSVSSCVTTYYAFIHNGLAHLMFSENQSSLIIVEVIDKDSMIYKAKGGFYEEGILSYGAL